MASLNVQISRRKKGRYVTIVETFVDPVTRKKSSRSVKSFGYIDDKLAEDPSYLEKIYQERDELRKNPAVVTKLRNEKEKRIYPSGDSLHHTDAYQAAPRLVYGDAAIRSLWEEIGLDKWFKKTRYNGKIPYDLDLAVFYMVAYRMLFPSSTQRLLKIGEQFFFDYKGNLKNENLYDALEQIAKRKNTLLRHITDKYRKSQDLRELEEKFNVIRTSSDTGALCLQTEEHLKGYVLVCLLADFLEKLMCQHAQVNGLDYPFTFLAELLTSLTLSPIYNSRNKEQLFLKTGLTVNSAAEGKLSESDIAFDAEKLMEIFGVEKLRTLETLPDIRARLKVHLPLTGEQS